MSDAPNHQHGPSHGRRPGLRRRLRHWWYDSALYRGWTRAIEWLYNWWHPAEEGDDGYPGYYGRSRHNRLGRAWRRLRRRLSSAAFVRAWYGAWVRLYDWWHPPSRGGYGYGYYGSRRHNRLSRAWRRLRHWLSHSAPARAWRYALIRAYDWWHPVSESTSNRPGSYGYYGGRRLNRAARVWRSIARRVRHSALTRWWDAAWNAFLNWWYPLSHDPHAYPAYGYYGRRRTSRPALLLGWVRQKWRRSWLARAWGRVLMRLWDWWYPEVESPGGYGYGYYGRGRMSRAALLAHRVRRWWRHSWLGQTWRRAVVAAWEWWYPEPDVVSGGYGYYGLGRVSRPVRFLRRRLRWFRKTWLGRKLHWLLDDIEAFAYYVGWRLRQDLAWWRIRQLLLRPVTWVVLAGALASAGLGYAYGLPKYRALMERQYSQQAELWFRKGDLPRAVLRARQTLSLNPTNPVATRVLAEVADVHHSPWALYWRQRAVLFTPTPSNQLALASTALKFETFPFATALRALNAVPSEARDTPTYHLLAGAAALKLGNLQEAEHHYAEASRLAPDDPAARMSLAVVRLHSRDPQVLRDARTTLELLRTDRSLGFLALRSLVAESVNRGELARAETLSEQVLTNAQATFSDRILHLAILRAARRPQFEELLRETQAKAGHNPFAIGELAAWMTSSGLEREALDWLNSLPGNMAQQGLLRIALADTYVAAGAWKELEDYLLSAPWPGLDHVRFAMLTLARWKQTGGARQSSAAWGMALRAASTSPANLNTLAQLVASWGWIAEAEDALWYAADRFADQPWPLQVLEQFYTSRRDSNGLRRVAAARLHRDPSDRLARNNYAMLSLLLNKDLANAHDMAEQVYSAEPQNPVFASTYAFSLHVQGRTAEALAVLKDLGLDQLSEPSVALYYGVLLAAQGERETARNYLERGARAFLLPEEMALLRRARGG